ncbi:MAG: thioredoxin family protein, partial [Gaiellaceae bacterium]
NVDENPDLASRYAVSGIPSVKAFRDGAVVDQFVGAVPPAVVSNFLDGLVGDRAAA